MRGEYLDKISVDFSVKDIVYVGSNKMACYCDYMERKEQEYIQGLFRRRGVTETPQFDEYIEYYDLG